MSSQIQQLDEEVRLWATEDITNRMETMEQEILVTLREHIGNGEEPALLFIDKVFKRYLNTEGSFLAGTRISVQYAHFEDRRDASLYAIWCRSDLETILARLDA